MWSSSRRGSPRVRFRRTRMRLKLRGTQGSRERLLLCRTFEMNPDRLQDPVQAYRWPLRVGLISTHLIFEASSGSGMQPVLGPPLFDSSRSPKFAQVGNFRDKRATSSNTIQLYPFLCVPIQFYRPLARNLLCFIGGHCAPRLTSPPLASLGLASARELV